MTNPGLKITCAQLNPTVGDIEGNARIMLETCLQYSKQSDLVIFPELFLCGYPPEDLALNTGFITALKNKITHICEKSNSFDCGALIPGIWEEKGAIYNAALLIEKGEIQHIFYKHKLPDNYVFDEPRTFTAGPLPTPFSFRDHSLGVMICEDTWHSEVPLHLKQNGAQFLIAINASPFHNRAMEKRMQVAQKAIQQTGLDMIYLNMVGAQDELAFDGRSFILNKKASITFKAPAFEENIFSVQIDNSKNITSTSPMQAPHDNDDNLEIIYKALVTGVKDYARKNGFKKALIGLSGGIDSALSATIATDALGFENLHCVLMPSEFNSDESFKDATNCADSLNVSYEVIPISMTLNAFESSISNLKDIAHENTQSRIRGTILMALSNMNSSLLLTTGNKSEVAVGYCTLYGDMNGGFNPLKDVYKTDIYKLARWRNEQNRIKAKPLPIPENILIKAPSAELRPNQKDEDSLPPYDLLDDILRLLVDYDNISCWQNAPQNIQDMRTKCLKHPQDIEKIAQLLKINEYKRFQSAPGTRISQRGFGRDRRYPITNHFINKIEKP